MTDISNAIIGKAIEIIGEEGLLEDAIEEKIHRLTKDKMILRRLCDYIPEAFGVVLVSHLPFKIKLPCRFSVLDKNGQNHSFLFDKEPVMIQSISLAQYIFHNGPRDVFQTIANKSALVSTINKALNEIDSLDGCVLGEPLILGVPAEFYNKSLNKCKSP